MRKDIEIQGEEKEKKLEDKLKLFNQEEMRGEQTEI